jgi:hypothetical protein
MHLLTSVLFYVLYLAYWFGVADRRKSKLAYNPNPTAADQEVKGVAAKDKEHTKYLKVVLTIFTFAPVIVSAANYFGFQFPGDLPWIRHDIPVLIGLVSSVKYGFNIDDCMVR